MEIDPEEGDAAKPTAQQPGEPAGMESAVSISAGGRVKSIGFKPFRQAISI